MNIAPGLLDVTEIRDALDADMARPPKMLPTDTAHPALYGREDEVAQWVTDRLSGAFIPTPEETVSVNKGRHGVRPVAIWDIPTRLTYRALASKLDAVLPPLNRGRRHWRSFQRAPLGRDGSYVITSDIAACYQTIDHGLLATELLVQTGRHATIEALIQILQAATGRIYGLPQQSWASDILAEAFLARFERVLTHRGLHVDRYNDDLRLTCSSWSEVIRALEVLEEESRKMGLSVNDLKTVTWKKSKYAASLDASDSLRDEIAAEAELDLTVYEEDEYGEGAEVEPDPEAVDSHSAIIVLERWVRVAGRSNAAARGGQQHRALLELLPLALQALASEAETDPEVLDHCRGLLRFERTMTPAVGRYLLSRTDADAPILATLDRFFGRQWYLNGWQSWWLQQPVARLEDFASGKGAPRRIAWARAALASAEHTPILRAEAARTLARHKQITTDELLEIYARSSSTVRPSLAAAIALLKPAGDIRGSIVGDSMLNEWVYDWADANA